MNIKQPSNLIMFARMALCFVFILPDLVYAQGVTLLQDFVRRVQAAQGTFQQTQVASSGKVTAQSSGEFSFSRPGKFIWTTQKPYEQLLQSDGRDLYIFDKDLNQVAIRQLDAALAASPAAILFGSGALERHFKLKDGPMRQGVQWVELEPLIKDTPFTHIAVGFRGKVLAGMELRDTLGNATALIFDHVDTRPLPAGYSFSFKLPKGADVVRN